MVKFAPIILSLLYSSQSANAKVSIDFDNLEKGDQKSDACVDDQSFRYNGVDVCEFVRSRSDDDREAYCTDYPVVLSKCPVSCAVCCDDDPDLMYQGQPACALLASLPPGPVNQYCSTTVAGFSCPVTCDTCPTSFTDPTASPTASPTPCDWVQVGSDIIGENYYENSGYRHDLSASGDTVVIGSWSANSTELYAGYVKVYTYDEEEMEWVQKGDTIDGEYYGGHEGEAVSISADGNTVAVGAHHAASNGTARVFKYDDDSMSWVQCGQDLFGEYYDDDFGISLSLSDDGMTLVVGAESNPGAGDDWYYYAGHVQVWRFDSGSDLWVQMGFDIDGDYYYEFSGWATDISADGNVVAIGAPYNGQETYYGGEVRVFMYDGSAWVQKGNDINDSVDEYDYVGWSVAISSDGNTLAIGAYGGDGNVNDGGRVRVYTYDEASNSWVQTGGDIDGYYEDGHLGETVALSADGLIVASGAHNADAAKAFKYDVTSNSWMKMGSTIEGDSDSEFGIYVSLSDDGRVIAVGAEEYYYNLGKVRVLKYECE